jgi:hypothetical protein
MKQKQKKFNQGGNQASEISNVHEESGVSVLIATKSWIYFPKYSTNQLTLEKKTI